jgi:sorbitol/mannitol transport system substrate-binding protein
MSGSTQRRLGVVGLGASLVLALSGCAGFGNLGNDPGVTTLTLASVNNPQMQDMNRLLPEFNKLHPDIKVNIIFLEEGDLRNAITKDVATGGGQYDIMTVGAYEVPIWGENGWLAPLDKVAADAEFNQDDILPAYTASLTGKDGKLYGEPFYGESSFLMYRKDIFEAKGLTVSENPTWDEVAALAAKADGAAPGMKGICLRGQPGWGQVFAPLTTVVNTFGGTWFDKDWNAKVDSPEFTAATEFYTKLVREHGEAGAAQAGFTECLNNMSQSKVATWNDATSAAGSLEADASPVKG